MRRCTLPVMLLAALALSACMRRAPVYSYAVPAQPLPGQVLEYHGPQVVPAPVAYPAPAPYVAPAYRAPVPVAPAYPAQGGPYLAEPAYTLDSGDRLRIVVFGQEGLTNTYAVDASGNIAMPLIGSVHARGLTPPQLAREVAARLRKGYVRDPSVTAEIVAYRPFFILGEVNNPGQYPYVAHMTVETAIAIAGGFAPRAKKDRVAVSRSTGGGEIMKFEAPVTFEVRPGDTIQVKERWF